MRVVAGEAVGVLDAARADVVGGVRRVLHDQVVGARAALVVGVEVVDVEHVGAVAAVELVGAGAADQRVVAVAAVDDVVAVVAVELVAAGAAGQRVVAVRAAHVDERRRRRWR